MKKIGMLTYHHTSNFGSCLQTYGLYKTIIDLGYTCEVIDYRNDAVEKREKTRDLFECRTVKDFAYYFLWEPKIRAKVKELDKFSRENMNIGIKTYYRNNISECSSLYDTYVVGSDLVWDFNNNGDDKTYFLDFVNGKKKISFGSSCGKIWEKEKRSDVIELLKSFSGVGVRERKIAEDLKIELGEKVHFVCDPTMLISGDTWKKFAGKKMIDCPYVVCYFEDYEKNIFRDAIEYGKKHDVQVYAIRYRRKVKGIKSIKPTTVEEFLSLIYYADAVFSASYHGMLFSLYFNKEVFYYTKGWNERQESLAKYFGIENRNGYHSDVKMDYSEINKKIDEFREYSMKYLENALK